MQRVNNRYSDVRRQIADAMALYRREPGSVQLLAVSKRQPAASIRELAGCGQRAFGENYLQEATAKAAELQDLALQWHFIGRLQSNKTQAIAANFSWVHALDRIRIATRLDSQRPSALPPLNVCVEVNLSGESGKAGIRLDEVGTFVRELLLLPRLKVRGLMALPAPGLDFDAQRASFRRLAAAHAAVDVAGFDTLSMGTSHDFVAAIAEGATIIRIGTSLFGPRAD